MCIDFISNASQFVVDQSKYGCNRPKVKANVSDAVRLI
jgi:hypothetical protein